MTGIIHDQNMEKQIDKHMGGCMAGFFNLFDRNHVLSCKRFYPKRLTPSTVVESALGSASSVGSPAVSREFERPKPQDSAKASASPDRPMTPAAPATPPLVTVPDSPARSPLAVASFEFKEGIKSPWKFTREAPRLSLDSRLHPREIKTTAVAAGGVAGDDYSERQRRSPSVVARLMGLDPLPPDNCGSGDLPEKKVELQRSASESRSRDLLHCRFNDGNTFPAILQFRSEFTTPDTTDNSNGGRDLSSSNIDNFNVNGRLSGRVFNPSGYIARSANPEPTLKPRRMIGQQQQRKVVYNFGDFFPEPKPVVTSIYGDVEKRLRMRGMDEPSMDLETLKQILEAFQLRGLLHHSSTAQIGRRDYLYGRRFPYDESPIVVMKPARSPRRLATEPSPPRFQSKTVPRRNLSVSDGDSFRSPSPRRKPPEMARNARSPMRNPNPTSPGRSESRSMSPATSGKGPMNVEAKRRATEATTTEPRRVSPVQSPRMGSRRLDQTATQPARRRRAAAEILPQPAEVESPTISDISFSTPSHTDTERWKIEDYYKDGMSLLERCDELLHSIAEMTSTSNATELQPSPVSVLDSSFYKEESSPSPVMKRTIDFKDQVVDLEEVICSPSSSGGSFKLKSPESDETTDDQQDPDFTYVSEITRASNYLPDSSDIFLLLEKQQAIKGRDTSKSSKLQRRLIFDTITEILDRKRQLPPWKSAFSAPHLTEIWSELQSIQKWEPSEDLFEVICGVMKRDLTQDSINGWGECQLDISEAVLDIERLIFKDLIGEAIRDLAAFSGKGAVASAPRRKLVF